MGLKLHQVKALCDSCSADTLKIKNFVEIALCSTVFEILTFLCFAIFTQKFENSKWPPFLARQNFFENWHGHSAEIPCGSKISSKSLYLARFSRYKHFCVLQFREKFENSKWPPFFPRNFLFEKWHGYSAEIPCGSKISSKSLYLAGFSRYKHFYVLQFLRKIRKFKMAAIFGETKIFSKLGKVLRRDTLRVKNFVEIALSSRVFEI